MCLIVSGSTVTGPTTIKVGFSVAVQMCCFFLFFIQKPVSNHTECNQSQRKVRDLARNRNDPDNIRTGTYIPRCLQNLRYNLFHKLYTYTFIVLWWRPLLGGNLWGETGDETDDFHREVTDGCRTLRTRCQMFDSDAKFVKQLPVRKARYSLTLMIPAI